MSLSSEQSLKHEDGMVSTLLGISMYRILVPLNAPSPIDFRVIGNDILVKPEPIKAFSHMVEVFSGKLMDSRLVQL